MIKSIEKFFEYVESVMIVISVIPYFVTFVLGIFGRAFYEGIKDGFDTIRE